MKARGRRTPRAFTLIEMVLSTGLLVMLVGTLYWFYGSSLRNREEGTMKARRIQLARVVLDRIAEDIRLCTGYTSGYGAGIKGGADWVRIRTLTLPGKELMRRRSITDRPLAGQFDLEEVRYSIAWDEKNLDENGDPLARGLARGVTRTFKQTSEVEGDTAVVEGDTAVAEKEKKDPVYAPEIKYIEFRYFDGATPWETWTITGGNSLPQMVRITIGFTAVLPEEYSDVKIMEQEENLDEYELRELYADRYTAVVRLVQADQFFRSRVMREASAFDESQEAK